MKTLLILLATLGLSLAAAAQTASSKSKEPATTEVFSQQGDKFWLVLNGVRQNAEARSDIKVNGLRNPKYKVKVIFENEKLGNFDDNIYVKEMDGFNRNPVYSIIKKKKGYVLRLVSAEMTPTELAANEHPGNNPAFQTGPADEKLPTPGEEPAPHDPYVVPFTTTDVKIVIPTVKVTSPDQQPIIHMVYDPTPITITQEPGVQPKPKPAQPAKPTPTKVQPKPQPSENPAPAPTTTCATPMASTNFNSQLASLKKESFSDTQRKMASSIIKRNCLSTSQIKALAESMSYSADQLSLLKEAYGKCTDKDNYNTLTEILSFSGDRETLLEFIDSQP
jgi:hypothetical protein